MIEDIWKRQKLQQQHWPVINIDEALAEHIAGIHEEAVELKRALGIYKQNVKEAELDANQALTECVDIFKHVLCVMIGLGIEPYMFEREFFSKSDVVDIKWLSQSVSSDRPIIAIDLDDVLADYATRFGAYDAEWHAIRGIDTPDIKSTEEAKKAFRLVGGYGLLKPIAGAVDGFRRLQEIGCTVGIVTSRPAQQMPRIYSDTINWLIDHEIKADFVLWNRDKVEALSQIGAGNVIVVENSYKHVMDLLRAKFEVVWLSDVDEMPKEFAQIDGLGMIVKDWENVETAVGTMLLVNHNVVPKGAGVIIQS